MYLLPRARARLNRRDALFEPRGIEGGTLLHCKHAPHVLDEGIDGSFERRAPLAHGGGDDVAADALADIVVLVAERVGGEVMRPADDEVGAQRRHLLAARHIGSAEHRQGGVDVPVGGGLCPIRPDRADDAVRDAEVDHQLRRPRVGDEHTRRHMRERERRRMSLAVRRDKCLAALRPDVSDAASLGIGEIEDGSRDHKERQQTEHGEESSHGAYAPVR